MQYREDMDGDQVLDVDDADLRNVFADKVSPAPNFEVFELANGDERGGVIVIEQGEQVPLVVEKTLRKGDGSAFITEGQAFTRDGSRSLRMGSDDFAAMMRYREELITAKIQELTEGLSQVVGIPDDQLANIDLNVTQSDDGVPVRDLVTTEAPKTIDEELKTAVKGSKGSGGHKYERRGNYEFLAQREDINLDADGDEKIEFLIRASLRNHLTGGYWLTQYEDDVDDLMERIIAEDVNGNIIQPLEKLLLVLGKKSHLEKIDDEYGHKYHSSSASDYISKCNYAVYKRVAEYTGESIKINDGTHSVRKLVCGNSDVDPIELMEEVVQRLLDEDNPTDRIRLREIELICLDASS